MVLFSLKFRYKFKYKKFPVQFLLRRELIYPCFVFMLSAIVVPQFPPYRREIAHNRKIIYYNREVCFYSSRVLAPYLFHDGVYGAYNKWHYNADARLCGLHNVCGNRKARQNEAPVVKDEITDTKSP